MKYNILILLCLLLFGSSMLAQSKITYVYSIKGKDTLKLDVYAPENIKNEDRLPTLLWMHGGGFAGGTRDSKAEQRLCEFATGQDYIGISISYRLLRKGKTTEFGCYCTKAEKLETFKQAVVDYFDAAKYIFENADVLHIDTGKVIAGGSSAGAETILNAAYMREYFVEDLPKYESVKFTGVLSLAGALVNGDYITQQNALPTVLFHGTEDNLVPFANAPHHYCDPKDPGYLILDGSKVIVDKLEELETSYYFNMVKGGKHELSSIPFDDLEEVFNFFDRTVLNDQVIQTKIIKTKKQ